MLAWLVAFAMFRAYTNKQLGKAGGEFFLLFLYGHVYPINRYVDQLLTNVIIFNEKLLQDTFSFC